MSLFVKKGITAHNPRAVTDGLIFYLDPNNAKCRSVNGLKFTDLIQKYSSVPDLSAGILLAKLNPLTGIDNNIFLTLTGSNSLSGVVGPDDELNALVSFTVQFWVKNNKPTSSHKSIFSNTEEISLPFTTTITVSTNYPYSSIFGTQGINGVYNRSVSNVNGKVAYQRRSPDSQTTRPFVVEWTGNKWSLMNNGTPSTHFISTDNTDIPPQVTSWNLVLTTFKFNIGQIPIDFFNTLERFEGRFNGDIKSTFYPMVSTETGSSLYLQQPTNEGADERRPSVFKADSNTPWALNLRGPAAPGYLDNSFIASSLKDYPWQSVTYSPNITALSASSNILINSPSVGVQPISGWYYFVELANSRPHFYRFFNSLQGYFEASIIYLTPVDDPSLNSGWYIYGADSNTLSFILSSNSTTDKPWEIQNWNVTNDRTFTSTTSSFSAILYNVPPITAVPTYPEDLTNINIIVSGAGTYDTNIRGLFLSGANNNLLFSYDGGIDDSLPFNSTLFQTNTSEWNCITLSQFRNKITLYKNSSFQTITNTSIEYFNLSSIFLGNDITLGQIFLYNKNLTPTEVRQNYNSFKSRYRTNDLLNIPIPNQILNSDFSLDNYYPVMAYDGNYYPQGPIDDGSTILTNYVHNSPLFFEYTNDELYGYRTFANRTFHELTNPYNILPLGHGLQPRLLKLFGVGTRFGVPNSFYNGIVGNGNLLRTIINTNSFTPTDSQSWVKYGVAQYVPIPIGATKVRFGASFLVQSNDKFRFNNFGGMALSFKKNSARSYVNIYPVQNQNLPPLGNSQLTLLAGLYGINTYQSFDADSGQNAMCQWMGPSNSRVKVKRLGSGSATRFYDISANNTFDIFNPIDFTVDIPTFSTGGGDSTNGFSDSVCLEMFFAEHMEYLYDDGINSGAIYFRDPFLYFE